MLSDHTIATAVEAETDTEVRQTVILPMLPSIDEARQDEAVITELLAMAGGEVEREGGSNGSSFELGWGITHPDDTTKTGIAPTGVILSTN